MSNIPPPPFTVISITALPDFAIRNTQSSVLSQKFDEAGQPLPISIFSNAKSSSDGSPDGSIYPIVFRLPQDDSLASGLVIPILVEISMISPLPPDWAEYRLCARLASRGLKAQEPVFESDPIKVPGKTIKFLIDGKIRLKTSMVDEKNIPFRWAGDFMWTIENNADRTKITLCLNPTRLELYWCIVGAPYGNIYAGSMTEPQPDLGGVYPVELLRLCMPCPDDILNSNPKVDLSAPYECDKWYVRWLAQNIRSKATKAGNIRLDNKAGKANFVPSVFGGPFSLAKWVEASSGALGQQYCNSFDLAALLYLGYSIFLGDDELPRVRPRYVVCDGPFLLQGQPFGWTSANTEYKNFFWDGYGARKPSDPVAIAVPLQRHAWVEVITGKQGSSPVVVDISFEPPKDKNFIFRTRDDYIKGYNGTSGAAYTGDKHRLIMDSSENCIYRNPEYGKFLIGATGTSESQLPIRIDDPVDGVYKLPFYSTVLQIVKIIQPYVTAEASKPNPEVRGVRFPTVTVDSLTKAMGSVFSIQSVSATVNRYVIQNDFICKRSVPQGDHGRPENLKISIETWCTEGDAEGRMRQFLSTFTYGPLGKIFTIPDSASPKHSFVRFAFKSPTNIIVCVCNVFIVISTYPEYTQEFADDEKQDPELWTGIQALAKLIVSAKPADNKLTFDTVIRRGKYNGVKQRKTFKINLFAEYEMYRQVEKPDQPMLQPGSCVLSRLAEITDPQRIDKPPNPNTKLVVQTEPPTLEGVYSFATTTMLGWTGKCHIALTLQPDMQIQTVKTVIFEVNVVGIDPMVQDGVQGS